MSSNVVSTLVRPDQPGSEDVVLARDPHWSSIAIDGVEGVRLSFRVSGSIGAQERAAILFLRFRDAEKRKIPGEGLYYQSASGDPFVYLDFEADGDYILDLVLPESTSTAEFALRLWNAAPESLSAKNRIGISAVDRLAPFPRFQTVKQEPLAVRRVSAAQGSVELTSDGVELQLNSEPCWFELNLTTARYLRADFTLSSAETNAKAVVCRVEFYDSDDALVPAGKWIAKSSLVGDYVYLPTTSSGTCSKYLLVPNGATRMRLGFQSWHVQSVALAPKINFRTVSAQEIGRALGLVVDGSRSARDVRVAFIADEFTFNSFRYECNAIAVEPDRWRVQMDEHAPDFLFCESAWSGADSDIRPWKGQIYASANFPKENRGVLLDILEYCKARGIPTVFWNKEDPTHFGDRVHDFVKTATEFDYVFTTAIECVDRYRSEYGVKNVGILPFATQPRLFNPGKKRDRAQGVAFAGGWYANHQDRCNAMDSIFGAVLESGLPLSIFDRFYGTDDPLHQYPERYQAYLQPPLAHADVSDAYKHSSIGVNINTVVDSATMFARRAFELASCNTMVISNPAVGLREFFNDGVCIIDSEEESLELLKGITTEQAESFRQTALTAVLTRHTYRHRFQHILDTLGIEYKPKPESVVLASRISQVEEAESVISSAHRLGDIVSSVVLLIGREVSGTDVSHLYERFNRFGVRVISLDAWEKYGAYDGISSEGIDVLLADPDQMSGLSGALVEQMLMHREYTDDILALAPTSDARYEMGTSVDSGLVMLPPSAFQLQALREREIRGLIYFV